MHVVFVTFLVTVTKYLSSLREVGFILAQFQRCQSVMVGRVWWSRADHIMAARKRPVKAIIPKELPPNDFLPPTGFISCVSPPQYNIHYVMNPSRS
jgi:hypothetical protein